MTDISIDHGCTGIYDTTVHHLTASGLTGYSAWFTAKRDLADPDTAAVFQKTLASGAISAGSATTDPAFAGEYMAVLTTTIEPADTEALPAGYAVVLAFDVKVKDGSGIETVVDSGWLTVNATATQAT